MIKQVLECIILNIVEQKDKVTITEKKESTTTLLEIKVAKEDMGRVIGKQGRIAKSIRTVIKSLAAKEHKKINIEFID